jgi:hypothetical protein
MQKDPVIAPGEVFVISNLRPSRGEKRLALAIVLALLGAFLIAAVFLSGAQRVQVPPFVPAYHRDLPHSDSYGCFAVYTVRNHPHAGSPRPCRAATFSRDSWRSRGC